MRHRPLCFACLALFLFLWGAVLMGGEKWFRELRPSPLDACAEEGEQIRFTGRVYQREERDAYQILYLKENSVQSEEQSFQISGIMVYDEKKKDLAIGSRLVVEGEAFPQRSARNPGGFDQRIYDRRRGIYGSVWATDIQAAGGEADWFMEGLFQFRQAWRRQLVEAMGEKDGETLSAILLGEKAGMDPEMKELYQDQGIGHILAISGLHLSLIGLGAYRVLRRGTGSYLAGGAAGIGFLGLYVVMIGLSVSVVRAFLMFLFRIGADITGRHYDGLTSGASLPGVLVQLLRQSGDLPDSCLVFLRVSSLVPDPESCGDPPFLCASGIRPCGKPSSVGLHSSGGIAPWGVQGDLLAL